MCPFKVKQSFDIAAKPWDSSYNLLIVQTSANTQELSLLEKEGGRAARNNIHQFYGPNTHFAYAKSHTFNTLFGWFPFYSLGTDLPNRFRFIYLAHDNFSFLAYFFFFAFGAITRRRIFFFKIESKFEKYFFALIWQNTQLKTQKITWLNKKKEKKMKTKRGERKSQNRMPLMAFNQNTCY